MSLLKDHDNILRGFQLKIPFPNSNVFVLMEAILSAKSIDKSQSDRLFWIDFEF